MKKKIAFELYCSEVTDGKEYEGYLKMSTRPEHELCFTPESKLSWHLLFKTSIPEFRARRKKFASLADMQQVIVLSLCNERGDEVSLDEKIHCLLLLMFGQEAIDYYYSERTRMFHDHSLVADDNPFMQTSEFPGFTHWHCLTSLGGTSRFGTITVNEKALKILRLNFPADKKT